MPEPETTLERLDAEYTQAIKRWSDYFMGEEAAEAGYGMAAGWGGAAGAASDEERLYLVEQSALDFHTALPYIRSMGERERSRYLAAWREHLAGMATLAAELVDALEKTLAELSEPSRKG